MTGIERTWRPHWFGRMMAWVYIVAFAVAVVAGTVAVVVDGEPGLLALTLVGGLPLLLLSVLGALRPYVRADQEGLHVQNPIRRIDLPWADVAEILPGYSGLKIRTHDEVEVAWSVQKSNLAGWLKRRTRADRVADVLQEMAAEHGRGDITAS